MSNQVITIVSDDNYIEHTKAIIMGCIHDGKYRGDFAVISPKGSLAASIFTEYGLNVLETELTGFFQKFEIFNPYFKQWDQFLYLDCDIIIQDDLQRLFDVLDEDNRLLFGDREDGDTLRTLPVHNRDEESNKDLYDWVKKEYPFIYERTFNTSIVLFDPSFIEDNTVQKLIELQAKVEPLNSIKNGATDQQIINLLMWNQFKRIPFKICCYWGLGEPENDIYSEFREYKGGEIPVALHYGRHYAPWIKKPLNTGAYWNHHLNTSCYDLYHKNLNLFNERFRRTL